MPEGYGGIKMIYRVERKENPFVQVDKGFVNDKRLGFKEKGILLYFLSKPDGWNFYAEEIAANSSDGLSAVKAGIQKLMKNGYIVRGKRQRNKSGQLGAYEYIVKEVSTTCENPTQVFPTQENPTQENRTLVKNEDSNIYKSNMESKDTSAEKSKDSPHDEPPTITLLLNDKSEYPVTQRQIDEWKPLYPAVDVMQEFRNMKAWLIANPTNRKTKRGIMKFINGWLSRAQNRASRQGTQTSPNASSYNPWGGVPQL